MSAVRVSYLPLKVTQKDIKVHFANPDHGGGPVKEVYWPLFDEDAVVIFEDPHSAETCVSHDHKILEENMFVKALPQLQVFTILEAQLDPNVTAYLEATENARDEIQYVGNLSYSHDETTHTSSLRGNWYQLEWAWKLLDDIMQRQCRIQRYIAASTQIKSTEELREQRREVEREAREREEETHPLLPATSQPKQSQQTIPVMSQQKQSQQTIPVMSQHKQSQQTVLSQPPSLSQQEEAAAASRRGRTDEQAQSGDARGLPVDWDSQGSSPVKASAPGVDTMREGNSVQPKADPKASIKGDIKGDNADLTKVTVQKEDRQKSDVPNPFVNDNPDALLSLEFRSKGLHVKVYAGDITLVETDVVVNAAMGNLVNGGGVALAIADAASPKMQKECDAHVKKNGALKVADTIHTCAGGRMSKKVRNIVHTVGPVWSVYQDKGLCGHELTRAFLNSMVHTAETLHLQSAAFPVISSGIFGVPLEVCLKSFLDAVLLFTSNPPVGSQLQEVHLVQKGDAEAAITVVSLRELIENGLEQLTEDAVGVYEKFEVLKLQSKGTQEKLFAVSKKVSKSSKK